MPPQPPGRVQVQVQVQVQALSERCPQMIRELTVVRSIVWTVLISSGRQRIWTCS
jgi:hypothetical protein